MIEVKNLVKSYGRFTAVKDVSFKINKGEIVGLLGPNGAGKSTTIRMICGYLTPDQGSIAINNINTVDDPLGAKSAIGYLPESAPLYEEMIVYDYLSYVGKIRNLDKERIDIKLRELAELCGLYEVMHKNIGELSKGYRQRVGLAHALIGDPDILILDEPTSGLDPNQIVEIRNLIKEVGKTKTIILCSHILSEVEATCDRIIIISQGELVANSSKSDLKQKYSGKTLSLTLELENHNPEEIKVKLKEIPGMSELQKVNYYSNDEEEKLFHFQLHYESNLDLRKAVAKLVLENQWTVLDLHQAEKSLENIFRELTQKKTPTLIASTGTDN